MPSSRQRATSPGWPAEVSIITVAPASSGRALIRSASVKPSISGMWASSRTSGERLAGRRRPPPARPAPPRPPSARRGRISPAGQRSLRGCGGWWRCRPRPAPRRPCTRAGSAGGGGAAPVAGQAEPGREVERAAPARLALDPDPAAHQSDQPGRDRQAQAGAAVLAASSSRPPAERLEDQPPACRRGCRCRCRGRRSAATTVAGRARPRPGPAPRRPPPPRPASVNLMALPTRLTRTCRSRPGSPTRSSGTSGATWQASSSPFWSARRASGAERVAEGVAQRRSRHAVQVELAGLDLGEVEDVVDDAEQGVGRLADHLQVVALLGASGRCRGPARSCR